MKAKVWKSGMFVVLFATVFVFGCGGGGSKDDSSFINERPDQINDRIPSVVFETEKFSIVSVTTALATANVIADGGLPVLERGFCWGVVPYPDSKNGVCLADNGAGTGEFSLTITAPGGVGAEWRDVACYVRGFATNANGTGWSIDSGLQVLAK